MTHPLLSAALQEAYASANTEVEVIDTVEVRCGSTSLYLCKGLIERSFLVDSVRKTFSPFPFEITKQPAVDDSGASTVSISVENVNGAVYSFLKDAKATNEVIYLYLRTYLSTSTSPQTPRPLKLLVQSAKINMNGVILTASASDVVNKAFPNVYYTYTSFPGLR